MNTESFQTQPMDTHLATVKSRQITRVNSRVIITNTIKIVLIEYCNSDKNAVVENFGVPKIGRY